jgi:hypothetical protein
MQEAAHRVWRQQSGKTEGRDPAAVGELLARGGEWNGAGPEVVHAALALKLPPGSAPSTTAVIS